MSLDFLPPPIYIAIILILSILLFAYAPNIYKTKGKAFSIGFILLGIATTIMAIGISIEKYFAKYNQCIEILVIIGTFFLVIAFILFIVVTWKETKTDPYRRKLLLTGLILISVSIIMLIIIVIIFVFIIPKEEDVSYLICKLINVY